MCWNSGARSAWARESDEFEVTFEEKALGLELEEVKYKGSSRVVVKRIVLDSAAAGKPGVKAGLVLVSANGVPLERLTGRGAMAAIRDAQRPVTLVLRDPAKFRELLAPQAAGESAAAAPATASATAAPQEVSTKIAPAREGLGGRNRPEQVLRVARTAPGTCQGCAGAKKGDLLELRYTVTLEDGGAVVDGSGRNGSGDSSIYFVLGQQPAGQFPPAWDAGLSGACIGEKRRVAVPPLLAYGRKGLQRKNVNIPADATLLYDFELLGVNGINSCR